MPKSNPDAYDVMRVLTHTNGLYRELIAIQAEYTGDFMGRAAKRDYLNRLSAAWAEISYNKRYPGRLSP